MAGCGQSAVRMCLAHVPCCSAALANREQVDSTSAYYAAHRPLGRELLLYLCWCVAVLLSVVIQSLAVAGFA